jgi:hypothetical protein
VILQHHAGLNLQIPGRLHRMPAPFGLEVCVFGSQVLEVMIGLLVIYLALSVVCSGIKEVIATLFNLRSKTLELAIRNMLQDANRDVAQKIFEHPVIAGTVAPGKKLPSYISSRNFALALLDTVSPVKDGTQPRTIQDLRAGIANLPALQLRKTLLGLVDAAQGDLESAQKKIEHWFDDTMERVSGWYKRMAQKLIFVAGLALCLALNADTFQISNELWSDEALRNAVVAQATKRVHESKPVSSASDGLADGAAPGLTLAQLQKVSAEVRAAHPLPLGWGRETKGTRDTLLSWPESPVKLLGVLVSSFAILLGAPFWFDLLNKFINLRISGDPPAPSR